MFGWLPTSPGRSYQRPFPLWGGHNLRRNVTTTACWMMPSVLNVV